MIDDPQSPVDAAEVSAVVEEIERGADAIEVPDELVKASEPSAPAPDEPPKALWLQVREMTVAQRVKLALRGNKDARMILLHDSNKLIRRLVMNNPRISEEELLMLAKDRNTDEEILRTIADHRDWMKVYALRAALVENAKTPAPKALQLLVTLGDREIARLAKSKNVPSVIATQARKVHFQKMTFR